MSPRTLPSPCTIAVLIKKAVHEIPAIATQDDGDLITVEYELNGFDRESRLARHLVSFPQAESQFKAGDRVCFERELLGVKRLCTGVVQADGAIAWECQVGSYLKLAPIHRKDYPKGGVYRAVEFIPDDLLLPLYPAAELAGQGKDPTRLQLALPVEENSCPRGVFVNGMLPPGCWIETGKVKGRDFRQAWLRSDKPMFPSTKPKKPDEETKLVKTYYLGREGSDRHLAAIAAQNRRSTQKRLEKTLDDSRR